MSALTAISKRKKELQQEMNNLTDLEAKEISALYFPELQKRFLGKCFKQSNSYSGSSKKWNKYTKVTEITPEDVYQTLNKDNSVTSRYRGYSFQVCEDGAITINNEEGYVHCLGTEIKEAEFDAAWNILVDAINSKM